MVEKTSVATLSITFDKSDVLAGISTTGKLYLSVNAEAVSCNAIGCRVLGQQMTQVRYSTIEGSGNHQRVEFHLADQRSDFLDQRFRLLAIPTGTICNGQYEYAFQFTIPSNAPVTLGASNGGWASCSIIYFMEAWLENPETTSWNIQTRQPFTVLSPPPVAAEIPFYIEPNQAPVHSFCCIRRGDILMGAVDSSNFTAGGTGSVKYAIRNASTVPIKAVEVSIDEVIRISAKGHESEIFTTLVSCRQTAQEAGLDQEPRTVADGSEGTDLAALHKMLETGGLKLNFTVPASAYSTYNGSIVRVEHVLTMTAITTFGTANPTLQWPVRIFSCTRPASTSAPADKELEGEGISLINRNVPEDVPAAVLVGATPLVSQRMELPVALCGAKAHTDWDSNAPVIDVMHPAVVEMCETFDQFVVALKQSCDPCSVLTRYIRDQTQITSDPYALNALTPEQYNAMFSAVTDPFEQQRLAEILKAALNCISCDKVAQAARACRPTCKREVVETLLSAGPVTDKANACVIKAELTPFQFLTLEKYFL